jgi:hypothetical protein
MEEIDNDTELPRPSSKSGLGRGLNEMAATKDPHDQPRCITLVDSPKDPEHQSGNDDKCGTPPGSNDERKGTSTLPLCASAHLVAPGRRRRSRASATRAATKVRPAFGSIFKKLGSKKPLALLSKMPCDPASRSSSAG